MKSFRYVGNGAGVPGLPHEITDEEARALGVDELLKEAVNNGSYVEVSERPSTAPRKSRGSAQGESESEVNNG